MNRVLYIPIIFATLQSHIALAVPLSVGSHLVDDFDGSGLPGEYKTFGYGNSALVEEHAHSGRFSKKISFVGRGWGCLILKTLNEPLDVSSGQISLWLRSTATGGPGSVAVKFYFANRSEWVQVPGVRLELNSIRDKWTPLTIDSAKSGFQWDGGTDINLGGTFDASELVKIGIVLFSAGAAAEVYVDDIYVISRAPIEGSRSSQGARRDPGTAVENSRARETPLNRHSLTGLIDDFSPPEQYNLKNRNDVIVASQPDGGLTDLDCTMFVSSTNNCVAKDGILSLTWNAPGVCWFTTLSSTGIDLTINKFLILRMKSRSAAGKIRAKFESVDGDEYVTEVPPSAVRTEFTTINLPLTSFVSESASESALTDIKAFALTFDDPNGYVEIDQVALAPFRCPNTIALTLPGGTTVYQGYGIVIEFLLWDETGNRVTDFAGIINVSVDKGFIAPSTISGFRNGELSGEFVIDGKGVQELTAREPLSGATDSQE